MSKTTAITVRLDPQVKEDAQAVLKELGLTTSQAISLFFKQVTLNKGLPFAVEIPNEETIQAIENGVNKCNVKTFENAEATLEYLGLVATRLDALIQQARQQAKLVGLKHTDISNSVSKA
jgi:DNA-damage-inducible protein J